LEIPIPGRKGGFAANEEGEEDVEGPGSLDEELEVVGAMEVGSGDEVCVRPKEVRSVGLSQFPAPPRPVCRYSGAGWEAERARARSDVAGGRASGSWMLVSMSVVNICGERQRWED
jgi:hypothetical protein